MTARWNWRTLAAASLVLAAVALAGCGDLRCDTAGNARGAGSSCGAHVPFFAGR